MSLWEYRMLTQTAKYALRALIYLAEQEGDGFCQTKEIADTIKVPANYLGKTLQKLAHARVLDSQKGLHGGFRTARSAERITLHEVLVAIEAIPRDMVSDSGADEAELPSEVYAKFAELSAMYNQFLKNATLRDLVPVRPEPPKAAAQLEAAPNSLN
jgi:Rrf2 family protein